MGSQAISYTTGVPAMCGALMLLTGKWTTKGVHTVEEFDPDPYLEALDQYGLPRSESHSPALVDCCGWRIAARPLQGWQT